MHFGWNRLDREMSGTYSILKGFMENLRKAKGCCNFGGEKDMVAIYDNNDFPSDDVTEDGISSWLFDCTITFFKSHSLSFILDSA